LNVIASSQARLVEELGEWIGRVVGPADMDVDNWAVTEIGRGVTASAYLAAVHYYHGYQRRVAAWWADGFDLLVTPSLPEPPPPLGVLVPKRDEPLAGFMRSGQLTHFLLPFNITGQPALSVPFASTDDGLPVGVQLIADFGREDLLLRVAAQLEEAHPWRDRLPPVFA
jgi:amidase